MSNDPTREVVPRSLTTGEAARFLGVSLASLRRWSKDGTGPPCWITPGKQLRYKLVDLERWQNERKVEA